MVLVWASCIVFPDMCARTGTQNFMALTINHNQFWWEKWERFDILETPLITLRAMNEFMTPIQHTFFCRRIVMLLHNKHLSCLSSFRELGGRTAALFNILPTKTPNIAGVTVFCGPAVALVSLKILCEGHRRLNSGVSVRWFSKHVPAVFWWTSFEIVLWAHCWVPRLCIFSTVFKGCNDIFSGEVYSGQVAGSAHLFYLRVDTHSLETNYAPQLPERRRPAVCNNQPCQEVLKWFGEALWKCDLWAPGYFPSEDLQRSLPGEEYSCLLELPSKIKVHSAFWKEHRAF